MAVQLEMKGDEQRGLAAVPVSGGEPHILHRVLKRIGMAGQTTNWLRRINLDDVNFDEAMFGGPKTIRIVGDSILSFGREAETKSTLTCITEMGAALPGRLVQLIAKSGASMKELTKAAERAFNPGDYQNVLLMVVWTGNDLTKKKSAKSKDYEVVWATGLEFQETTFALKSLMAKYKYKCFIGPGKGSTWKLSDDFDLYSAPVIDDMKQLNIPTFTGETLFQAMTRRDVWHPQNTRDNRVLMTQYFANAAIFVEAFEKLK
ncbi:MAG: hypothetical protein GY768_17895, partial [Planctomycetaceae bacterium]|nr:hypothetical protein [Planctomycetaceae bacterium]